MSTITVRNLDPEIQRKLKVRAAHNNRSMESEARAILSAAVAGDSLVESWLAAAADLRGPDIPVPARSAPREVDLG